MESTGARVANTVLKNKNKIRGITLSTQLILYAYNIAIQSRQFGIGREIDTQTKIKLQRNCKQTHADILNLFLTKMPKQFNGRRAAF